MSDGNKETQKPYHLLGRRLQQLRETRKESPTEVSAAVEIDEQELLNYESGQAKPDEEILLLLISYFSVKESEAETMFKLAGYDRFNPKQDIDDAHTTQPLVIMMPADPRITFTDQVNIQANKHGVVLNFLQTSPNNKSQVVSRVGMSRDHAKSMIDILQKTMYHSEQKKLPPNIQEA